MGLKFVMALPKKSVIWPCFVMDAEARVGAMKMVARRIDFVIFKECMVWLSLVLGL